MLCSQQRRGRGNQLVHLVLGGLSPSAYIKGLRTSGLTPFQLLLQMGLEEVTSGYLRNKTGCFPEGSLGVTQSSGWWSSALWWGQREGDGMSGWQKALGGWR